MTLRALAAGLALAGALAFGAAPADARPAWVPCPGTVWLDYGDSASRIIVWNTTCKRAKRVIAAPASTRGFRCSNPFDRPYGSGGYVRCRKGWATRSPANPAIEIRFLYGQS